MKIKNTMEQLEEARERLGKVLQVPGAMAEWVAAEVTRALLNICVVLVTLDNERIRVSSYRKPNETVPRQPEPDSDNDPS